MEQITMVPSKLIVFEGLDATGKSTQVNRISEAAGGRFGAELFAGIQPLFTSQPSGADELGRQIYKITEEEQINNVWTRQFLHLASHANHYQNTVLPHLEAGHCVFMDRCWWSTVAYGYFGGQILDVSIPEFMKIATLPTQGRMPDVVFVFEHPWQEDRHNTEAVVAGYEWLVQHHFTNPHLEGTKVVPVPPMGVEECTAYIFEKLTDLDLTA